MKSFFKYLFATILGLFIFSVIWVAIFFGIIGIAMSGSKEVKISDNSVFKSGQYPFWELIFFGSGPQQPPCVPETILFLPGPRLPLTWALRSLLRAGQGLHFLLSLQPCCSPLLLYSGTIRRESIPDKQQFGKRSAKERS